MITKAAVTPGKTKHILDDGYEPWEWKFILVDKDGKVRISNEDIEAIATMVADKIGGQK